MRPGRPPGKTDSHEADTDKPEVYSIRRVRSGWELSRRGLFEAVAAVTVSANASTRLQAQGCPSAGRSHLNVILALAISPNGRLLASGGSDDTVKLWSLPDGNSFRA